MSLNNLAKIVDKIADELAKKKNVVAVAIGKKWTNGKPTDEDAIIVLVEKKESKEALSDEDVIPSTVDGVTTDVIGKVGVIEKFSYTARMRPAQAGISCGHPRITAGTIGAYFHDRSGELVLLSNNHVLANENNAKIGDPIWQPGRHDRGRSKDKIAQLKAFQRLVKTNESVHNMHAKKAINYNLEDSAIASVKNHRLVRNYVRRIGKITGFNLNPTVRMPVQKCGRTTDKTVSRIIGIRASVYVRYGMGTLVFRDQILTHAMSRGGDSGSVLLDMGKRAVGLLFAGSRTITVHNRIYYPVTSYGLRIISEPKPRPKPKPKPRRTRRTRRTRRARRPTRRAPARRRPRRTRRPRRARRPARRRRRRTRRTLGGGRRR